MQNSVPATEFFRKTGMSDEENCRCNVSPLHVHATCPLVCASLNKILSPQQTFFEKRVCHMRKTVAATFLRYMSPQHVPWCVPALSIDVSIRNSCFLFSVLPLIASETRLYTTKKKKHLHLREN